jgi:glycosyltransferase involved in cell wall biosynthesis
VDGRCHKKVIIRILLITDDVPYPPLNGGKVDRWNRIVALSRQGASVHLTAWEELDDSYEPDTLYACCESLTVHRRNRAPFLALHPKYPTGTASRILSSAEYEAELHRAERISPDVVFLDALKGGVLAMSLAQRLDIPLVYRAHNVEHWYLMQMSRVEKNLIRKALLAANALRTRRLEQHVREHSSLIYHISSQDYSAWANHPSASKAKVLNFYLHPDEKYTAIAGGDGNSDIDVLYVGNLHTPNNLFGLRWFVQEIVPLLKGLRIVVAGSRPTPEIKVALSRVKVQLIANPKEVLPLYRGARVLVNPIWHGSGLNIKMVEALATGKPVVSTSRGTRGLVKRLRAHVHVADSPQSFASAILRLRDGNVSASQQNDVAKEHSWTKVADLINELNELIGER